MTESSALEVHRPPDTNRGVYPLTGPIQQVIETAVFDAYSATVYAEAGEIIMRLHQALEMEGEKVQRLEGQRTRWYDQHAQLCDQFGKRLVAVHYGGRNGSPLVQCTGHTSPVVADVLRSVFEYHRPNRIDSCIDRRAPKLFDTYKRLTMRLAKRYGLRWAPIGDWATPDAGRTIELGSRRSQIMLRIYEKGLLTAKQHGLPVTDELRHHVRCEVEFKPDNKTARKAAVSITPQAVWGTSEWLADFAKQAFAVDAERVKVTHRREADHHRALRFMARQYRTHLSQLLDECGGDLDRFAIEILERADLMPSQAA